MSNFHGPFIAIAQECVAAVKSGQPLLYDDWRSRYPIIDREAFAALRQHAEIEALVSLEIVKPKPLQISNATYAAMTSQQQRDFVDSGGSVFGDPASLELSGVVDGHDGRRISVEEYEAMSSEEQSAFVMPRN